MNFLKFLFILNCTVMPIRYVAFLSLLPILSLCNTSIIPESSELTPSMKEKTSFDKQEEPFVQFPKRLTRSTPARDNTKESFWSKVQISSLEIGSMPYDDYGINIYSHINNEKNANNQKQYFYAPISQLLHKSASANFNNVTKQPELTFYIQMWNEGLEEQIRKFSEKLVKHPVEKEQVRVLPISKVKLFSKYQSDSYRLKDEWVDYRRNQNLLFSITCSKFDQCSRLSEEMKSNPEQFRDLRLDFTTSPQASTSQEITIRMETILDGSFVSKLIQRFPDAKEVFLTTEDEHRLLTESKSNIIIASVEDPENLDLKSHEKITDWLKNLLIESRGKITFYHSSDVWESLFWNEEGNRPDKIARTLNEIYKKLSKTSMDALVNCVKDDPKSVCDLPNASLLQDIAKFNNYSKVKLEKLLKDSKGRIILVGNELVPKPIEVSKVNLEKLRDKISFTDKKMIVSFSNSILSSSVNVKPKYNEEETSLILQGKGQLQRHSSGKPPSSCQELSLIGHYLNGIYIVTNKATKMVQTVYCQFHSSVSQELIGNIDVKTKSIHFNVQRNSSFSGWGSSGVIPFDLARLNEGGAMNVSSGVFTAPFSGIYHFEFSAVTDFPVDFSVVYLQVNGQSVAASLFRHANQSLTLTRGCLSLTSYLRLKSNDRVNMYNYAGTLYDYEPHGNHFTQFNGWLVEQDLA